MTEAEPPPPFPARVYGLFRHRPPLASEPDADKVKVVFDMVRELTKDEYDEAAAAVMVVERVLEGFDNNLSRSFTELSEATERLVATFGSSDMFQDKPSWMPELLHRVTNLSVALVMHQIYVVSEIAHLYGEDSAQHAVASKAFADLFDDNLSYRIVYSFRNAVVHSSRRLVSAHASSRLVQTNGIERIDSEVSMRLSRSAFAETKPNAKMKKEVLALPEDPELLEACRDSWEKTQTVQARLDPLLYPTRDAAVQTLWNYVVETAALGGYGPYFDSIQAPDPTVGMQMVPMTHSIHNYVWRAGMEEGFQPPYVLVENG